MSPAKNKREKPAAKPIVRTDVAALGGSLGALLEMTGECVKSADASRLGESTLDSDVDRRSNEGVSDTEESDRDNEFTIMEVDSVSLTETNDVNVLSEITVKVSEPDVWN
jgi:hypothetical protein